MKISILLPFKENFSPNYAGAVSLFVNDTINCSIYKKKISVFGTTDYKSFPSTNYINIDFKKKYFLVLTNCMLINFLLLKIK